MVLYDDIQKKYVSKETVCQINKIYFVSCLMYFILT
jgi:hypothetical protein